MAARLGLVDLNCQTLSLCKIHQLKLERQKGHVKQLLLLQAAPVVSVKFKVE